ncbi:hypothetical protein EIK77_000823 [Talaromyces pinophilus]|nr:hypothetical protein EIK77_000823 [Talaromyces pinophilus]
MVSKSPSEDTNPFGKPGQSAASSFGGLGSSMFSTSKSAFGMVSKSPSEDTNPFGKPGQSAASSFGGLGSSMFSTSSKSAFGMVSKSPSEDTNPFGKPGQSAASSFGGLGSSMFSTSSKSAFGTNPFGKPTGSSFGSTAGVLESGSSFGSSTAYNTSIEDTQVVLKPPPGAWPGSDMFNLPSYTSPTVNDFDGPLTVKPPPGAWPGDVNMFNIASARSIDPEQLPCGYYRYEDGTTLNKYADGSMVRDFGAFRINTDPHGKSVKDGPFTITPISNEHIPKQMGFPQPIHPNESGSWAQYGWPGLSK